MRNIDLVQLAIQGWKTDRDPVTDWDASYSPELQNLTPVKSGILQMVKGYETAGVSSEPLVNGGPCVGLFGVEVEDLTSGVAYKAMLYAGGDAIGGAMIRLDELTTSFGDDLAPGSSIYSLAAAGGTALAASGEVRDMYYESAGSYQNYVYFCHGTKNYRVFRDATTHPAQPWQMEEVDPGGGGTKPAANKIPRIWLGRLWLGGDADKRRTIIYSETSDIEDFPAANAIVLQSPGGEFASMGVWERDMFVFLEHNICCIPFALAPADYHEIDMATGWGCIAPYTLRRCGMHGLVCLSDVGVMIWPGQTNLAGPIDESLAAINESLQAKHRLRAAYAWYNAMDDSYNMLITSPDSVYNSVYLHDEWWKYYFETQRWVQIDIWPRASIGAVINYGPAGRRQLFGTYKGYVWYQGNSDGAGADRHNGTITNVVSTTVFDDSAAAFTIAGNGLDQMPVYIISGTAAGQRRVIASNTATQLTVETATSPAWVAGDGYIVCAQRGRFVSPWLHMGDPHSQKRFAELRLALNQDAIDKNYELRLFRDGGTSAARTIRGTFHDQNCVIPLDFRAKKMKIEFDVISNDDQPAFRSIRLSVEAGTYG